MAGFLIGQSDDLDHDQNLNYITCSFYHPEPFYNISFQFAHTVLNIVAPKQTNKQTGRPADDQSNSNHVKQNV